MKANIENLKTDINGKSHRLENGGFMEEYSAILPHVDEWGNHKTPVTLRLYTKTGNRWTACIWIHGTMSGQEVHGAGSGTASGYGYHKPSAAAGEAIAKAGIKLSEPIDGRGDSSIRDAVLAIAKAVTGKRKIIIHKSHA